MFVPRFRLCAALALLGGCAAPGMMVSAAEWIDAPLSPETWWEQSGEWMTKSYDIPLAAGESLEHMLNLNEGAMIVYHWTVDMADASLLTSEFHGHTEIEGTEPGTVMFYSKHTNGEERGSLRAPFTGVHGWYLNNESEQDIVVKLEVSGYFSD